MPNPPAFVIDAVSAATARSDEGLGGEVVTLVGNYLGALWSLAAAPPVGWRTVGPREPEWERTLRERFSPQVVSALIMTGGVGAALLNPIATLAAPLVDLAVTKAVDQKVKARLAEDEGQADAFVLLWDLLDEVSAQRTIVLLSLGDAAVAPMLLRAIAGYSRQPRFRTSRLVVVVGIDAGVAAALGGVDTENRFGVDWATGLRLEALSVPPLNEERVAGWLRDAEFEIARLLVAVSGGDDFAAATTWEHWRSEGAVEQKAGRWRPTGELNLKAARAYESVIANAADSRTTRRALWTAALFGEDFSPLIVADALVRAFGIELTEAEAATGEAAKRIAFESADGAFTWRSGLIRACALRDLGSTRETEPDQEDRLVDELREAIERSPDATAFRAQWLPLTRDMPVDLPRTVDPATDGELAKTVDGLLLIRAAQYEPASETLARQVVEAARGLALGGFLTLGERAARRALDVAQSMEWEGPRALHFIYQTAAWVIYRAGQVNEARDLARQAIDLLDEAEHTPLPPSREQRALALFELGIYEHWRGDLGAAGLVLEEALVLRQQGCDENPNPASRVSLARTLFELGVLARKTADASSTTRLGEALQLFQETYGTNPTTLQSIDIATTHHEIGVALAWAGHPENAIDHLEAAQQLLERAHEAKPTRDYRRRLAVTLIELGKANRRVNRDLALKQISGAVVHLEGLIDGDRTPTRLHDLASAVAELGRVARDDHQVERAEELLADARQLSAEAFALDPSPDRSRELAAVVGDLLDLLDGSARHAFDKDDLEEARRYAQTAIDIETSAPRNDFLGCVLTALSLRHVVDENAETAEVLIRSAVNQLEAAAATEPTPARTVALANALNTCGLIGAGSDSKRAQRQLHRAVALSRSAFAEEPSAAADVTAGVSLHLLATLAESEADAIRMCKRALSHLRRAARYEQRVEGSLELALAILGVGTHLLANAASEPAEEAFRLAHREWRKLSQSVPPIVFENGLGVVQSGLGIVAMQRHDDERAIGRFRDARRRHWSVLAARSPATEMGLSLALHGLVVLVPVSRLATASRLRSQAVNHLERALADPVRDPQLAAIFGAAIQLVGLLLDFEQGDPT